MSETLSDAEEESFDEAEDMGDVLNPAIEATEVKSSMDDEMRQAADSNFMTAEEMLLWIPGSDMPSLHAEKSVCAM